MTSTSRTSQSSRLRLEEAEAQLRVARSPYASDAQRLERYLWAAFLAARYTREDPACFKACRILQRSAQGFLEAWHATSGSPSAVRVFYVGGERFELVGLPGNEASDGRLALRWIFSEPAAAEGRSVAMELRRQPTAPDPQTAFGFPPAPVFARSAGFAAA